LYRCISDFKKDYQPRTNVVKDEKSDLVTYFHSILARWWNHFFQLLNVHGVIDVRQTEIHTAEPIVSVSSALEFEIALYKLKRDKSPGIDQISAEFIKAGGRTIRYEFSKLINSIWINDKLLEESIIVHLFIRKVIKQTVVIIQAYQFCQLCTKLHPASCCQG
jgi:hypothetical protein